MRGIGRLMRGIDKMPMMWDSIMLAITDATAVIRVAKILTIIEF